MFKFVVFAALIATSLAIDLDFETCEGAKPFLRVLVPECSARPCGLGNGDVVHAHVAIRLERDDIHTMPTTVTFITKDGEKNYELPNGDACFAMSPPTCPQPAGVYFLAFAYELADLTHGEPVQIKVDIKDENGDSVGCGIVNSADFN